MAEDIILLGLNSRSNIIQENNAVMITTDVTVTADIIADAVIMQKY